MILARRLLSTAVLSSRVYLLSEGSNGYDANLFSYSDISIARTTWPPVNSIITVFTGCFRPRSWPRKAMRLDVQSNLAEFKRPTP
ncbi:unnamed protein product [Rhizoctonia solani]|uniref:Uncharacterized protein n=1 Tax=Rhizoctonia solani TaxID=456999 RepID=A0A8H3HMH2_9AGAM|nr:unnamed protein product [Rhizoctonia solani]